MDHASRVVVTAILVSTVVAVPLAIGFVALRSQQKSVIGRAACLVGVIVTVLLAPSLVDFLVRRLNVNNGVTRVFIDEGLVALWLPSFIAVAFAAATGVKRAKRAGG